DPASAFGQYKEALALVLCIGPEAPGRTPHGLCQAMDQRGWDLLAKLQATYLVIDGSPIGSGHSFPPQR
ncbi:MAG: hypothetical protein GY704_15980, partial [Phycisphaeraceae bacterium]|nr:hypothetical protein [Phycisphaeraceae bacterium]